MKKRTPTPEGSRLYAVYEPAGLLVHVGSSICEACDRAREHQPDRILRFRLCGEPDHPRDAYIDNLLVLRQCSEGLAANFEAHGPDIGFRVRGDGVLDVITCSS